MNAIEIDVAFLIVMSLALFFTWVFRKWKKSKQK